ncbi:hypothetical protein ACTOB_003571 [Actinoplanes oblitus]|uniref:Uncharacterized protein n=1 Tax=Actinoplanes oblitus TaxID=3040509 RepID=A0ABY8WS27_9ACTN|nr:hypothetical protein [Actinoplanes oblitus]WIM99903.1 hypothetical protein ACTOB_003571 [Actinoplanes oblitus]
MAVLASVSAALVATAGPALASDTSFSVTVKHSNGTIVSTMSGNVVWYNRSAALTNIKQYIRGGECSYAAISSYSVLGVVDYRNTAKRCPSSNTTYSLNNILLNGNNEDSDGDGQPGPLLEAITDIDIELLDVNDDRHAFQVLRR